MLRILGIDPGTRVLGYGLVILEGGRLRLDGHGVIRTDRAAGFAPRLLELHRGLLEIFGRLRPDVVAIEEVFHGKNFQSAIRLGEGRGIALLAAAEVGVTVAEYPTALVKKAVAGLGRADKEQIQRMVQRILGLAEPPRPADASDAIAVAICHGHRAGSTAGKSAPAGRFCSGARHVEPG
ncbi:MAG: crossover junction endodeoxyribonuclease RuvC [Planctomycetes bacterium]|nr:crossover junction endodeoxyribonuclease RuvC [Planctomycetota bacterium]